MTDHYFNFIFIENCKKWKHPKTITYRPYSQKNIKKFDEILRNHDFNDIFNMNDPNGAYNELINTYDILLIKVIPEKAQRQTLSITKEI